MSVATHKTVKTMKKTYINPEIAIVKMASQTQMLAGSLPKGGESITDESSVLSREDDWDDWDD